MPVDAEQAEKTAQETSKGKEIPTEETEKKEAAPAVPDPVEAAARADGWKPKEEYTGDPEKYVDAKTWVEKGPLLKRISSQSAHIKTLSKTVDAMVTHFKKNVEHEVNRRIAELKAERREAIKEADVEKVEKLDKEIDAQKEIKEDVPSTRKLAPEIESWLTANAWYGKDREATRFAKSFNDAYLQDHPGDLEGSLEETTKATRRAFPEKFGKAESKGNGEEPGKKHLAPAVEDGGIKPGRGKTYSVSRLTEGQKLAHDQYIKAGTFDKEAAAAKMSPSEYYIKQLDEIGDLQK
jgi:hypothetical protein